jgi:M6 family metalloprotease-like protein
MIAKYAIFLLGPVAAWAQSTAAAGPWVAAVQDGATGQVRAIPEVIQKLYARMDADYERGAIDDIRSITIPNRKPRADSSSMPFQNRTGGFLRLLGSGIRLASRTTITSVQGFADNYAAVTARQQLLRSTKTSQYAYEIVYRDIWSKTAEGWKLRESPPVSVRGESPVEPPLPNIPVASIPAASTPALKPEPVRQDEGTPCSLASGRGLTLGQTDYTSSLRPRGPLTAVMVFVEFPDALHEESTEQIYELLVPYSTKWINEASNGVASLHVTPVHRWYQMQKPSTEYTWASDHKIYIKDVLEAAAGAQIDFLKYDIVYIVAARNFKTGALNALPGAGVPVPGGELRQVVMFGDEIHTPLPNLGANMLLHETGHLFGLPDLYETGASDSVRQVGGWDDMSWIEPGAHFGAWNKAKLGWISHDQIQCVESGTAVGIVTPVETPGGLKAFAIPVSASRAYVVEARELIGMDAGLCDEGLLIYTVDTLIPTGHSPMQVIGGTRGASDEGTRRCGPAYDATLNLRPGKKSSFRDANTGVVIELLDATLGAYTVRVSRTAAGNPQQRQ